MGDGKCRGCGTPLDREKGFESGPGELLCVGCFVKRAEGRKPLSGEDRKRLKEAVKEEMDGLLPRDALCEAVEEGYGRLVEGEGEFDEEVGRMVNEVERLAGLSMCREMLGIVRGLQDVLVEQEDEIRQKMRRLAEL